MLFYIIECSNFILIDFSFINPTFYFPTLSQYLYTVKYWIAAYKKGAVFYHCADEKYDGDAEFKLKDNEKVHPAQIHGHNVPLKCSLFCSKRSHWIALGCLLRGNQTSQKS